MTASRREWRLSTAGRKWSREITRLICRRWRRRKSSGIKLFGILWSIGASAKGMFRMLPSHTWKGLLRQSCKSFRQHQSAADNIVGRCIFVGTMTVTIAAGNEQHGNRSDAAHEKRIVMSAADHGQKFESQLVARLRNCIDQERRTISRRVGIQ